MTTKYRSRLENLNGAPTIFVNDKPIFLSAPYLAKAPYETFAKVGSGLYMLNDHHFGVNPDGSVDTDTVEKQIVELLEKEPGAFVLVRSFPPVPRWWLDAHPEEVRQFDIPVTDADISEADHYRDVSYASDLWVKDVCGWYAKWCGYFHKRFGGQVIGYQFGAGAHGENGASGAPANDDRWFCYDFSPVMLRYFRGYLQKKYVTNEALQKAWSQPDVTFATAQIPDRIERLRTEWFTFRDPLRAQTADYYTAYAARVQDNTLAICQAIKDATNGECLAGSHLGGIMDNGFHGAMLHQLGAQLVHKALQSPAIDLFTTPASYIGREPGGDTNPMTPAGSLALHGKLLFQDQDTRTSVLPPGGRKAFILSNIAADVDESTHILKRDFGHMLIGGYGCWWHPMVRGMYDHPKIEDCLRRFSEIGKASLHLPRGVADNSAAMIADEHSAAYQQCTNRLFYSILYHQRQFYWNRSGIPWNVFLHDDLGHPNLPQHKLYYFLNTFFLTDTEMEVIQRKLRGSGATAIWTYAPGIQSPAGLSLERASRLTGFRLKAVDVEALPLVTITNRTHPYVTGMEIVVQDRYAAGEQIPVSFGTGTMGSDDRERGIGPVIYVDDPDATVLGEVSCLRQPGFCVKEMDGWTSVYSAAPMLNQYLLRNIARAAGLHVWSTGDDIVFPGKSFVMIHAKEPGEKTIKLPYATDVYECYDGRVAGKNLTEIKESMERFATSLYFLGSKEQYEAALRK